MKYVYSIISDDADIYLEQLLVSVYSLRLYHPNEVVEIITDRKTSDSIYGKRSEIKQYVSKITTIDCPSGFDKMRRSRYLKTNIRKFVGGDYLFIDCDTIICEPLDNIEAFEGEIGMVADLNGELSLSDKNTIEKCKKAGFPNVERQPYFNSGVIYAKDTPAAHRLYEEWYRLWQESDAKDVPYDQPALCQANINMDFPIKEMSGIWNCQVKFYGHKFLPKAKIIHYYSNNGAGQTSYAQNRIFEYVKEKGCIDGVIDNVIRHPCTIFYTAVTINSDKAFEFFYSEMIHYYFNVPPAYRLACRIATIIGNIVQILNQHKITK